MSKPEPSLPSEKTRLTEDPYVPGSPSGSGIQIGQDRAVQVPLTEKGLQSKIELEDTKRKITHTPSKDGADVGG